MENDNPGMWLHFLKGDFISTWWSSGLIPTQGQGRLISTFDQVILFEFEGQKIVFGQDERIVLFIMIKYDVSSQNREISSRLQDQVVLSKPCDPVTRLQRSRVLNSTLSSRGHECFHGSIKRSAVFQFRCMHALGFELCVCIGYQYLCIRQDLRWRKTFECNSQCRPFLLHETQRNATACVILCVCMMFWSMCMREVLIFVYAWGFNVCACCRLKCVRLYETWICV